MKHLTGAVLAAALIATRVASGAAPAPDPSTLNPAALKYLVPDRINWKPAAGLTGTDVANLVGDPAKPEFYIVLNRFHPGNFSRPHYHANDRYIMVVSGTWWVGTGTHWDPEHNTVPMKAGTFVTHVGREVHYDGNRSNTTGEDTIVMILGQGPGARIECEGLSAETSPGPCAAAKAAAGKR